MTWRNQETHKAETKAVKTALLSAGHIVDRVGHGTGTAWAWLEIKTNLPKPQNCQCVEAGGRCEFCRDTYEKERQAIFAIVRQVTGRTGEYNGDVSVDVDLTETCECDPIVTLPNG